MNEKTNPLIRQAIKAHREALKRFELTQFSVVAAISEKIIECFHRKGKVYLCGNGGSAADCQHIAGELIGRFRRERKALPAIALTTDSTVLTCVSNDYRFEDIFSRSLEGCLTENDLLWAFSTSGTSANILKAATLAKEIEAVIISFTGKRNSPLEALSDVCLCADCPWTSTAQEIHQLAYHIICDMVEEEFSDQ